MSDVLIVTGSFDRVLPASYSKRFALDISGASVIRTIEGAGHALTFDAPDETAIAVLDFLAGMTDRYAIRLFDELFIPRAWGRVGS